MAGSGSNIHNRPPKRGCRMRKPSFGTSDVSAASPGAKCGPLTARVLENTMSANQSATSGPVTPSGLNHLVLNVRNMDKSHRFWTEVVGLKQVGELKATPDGRTRRTCSSTAAIMAARQPPRHRSGREHAPARAAEGMGHVRHAGGDQPHRDRLPEPRGLAGQLEYLQDPRREVQSPRRSRHDAQPVHQRPERLRSRTALRVAARRMGRRHRRRPELRAACRPRAGSVARHPKDVPVFRRQAAAE